MEKSQDMLDGVVVDDCHFMDIHFTREIFSIRFSG